MDTFFKDLNFQKLNATVRSDKKDLLELNLELGYEIVKQGSIATSLQVSKTTYLEKRKQIDPYLLKIDGNESSISLSSEEKLFFLAD